MTEFENFTEAEIDAFAGKLHDWGGTLSDRERTLLRAVLLQAESSAEVEGFGTGLPNIEVGPKLPSLKDSTFKILSPITVTPKWNLAAYVDRWDPTE
ncbi:MAG: hypothetical protein WC184_12200 [Acidimicrobiia bacterium]